MGGGAAVGRRHLFRASTGGSRAASKYPEKPLDHSLTTKTSALPVRDYSRNPWGVVAAQVSLAAADSGPTPHRALPLSADDRVASLSRTWYLFNCRGNKRKPPMKAIPPFVSIARIFAICALFALGGRAYAQTDPLPSWNNGPAKQAIVEFVQSTTAQGGPQFVPPAERIATFDNDGTLWAEQPMYFQMIFAFDRVKALAPQHPEWKDKQPFASLLKGDVNGALAGGEHAMVEIVMATHAGMTTEEFEKIVKIGSRRRGIPSSTGLIPSLFINPWPSCWSTCGRTGTRPSSSPAAASSLCARGRKKVYGIPPEQIVGSSIKTKYEVRDGKPVLVRLAEVDFIDDKAGKPVGINSHIGRRPIAAFGNSDGDQQMLEWTARRRRCAADDAGASR